MRIRSKIFIGLFAAAAFAVAVVFVFSYYFGRDILIKTIVGYNTLIAKSEIDAIDRAIYRRMERWQADLSSDVALRGAIGESNAVFSEMADRDQYIEKQDAAWKLAAVRQPTEFMVNIINNDLSAGLREKIQFYENKYGRNVFPEIFLTNKYGALVAASGQTSDYWQADEDWWMEARDNGIMIGDVSFDESSGVNSLEFAMRLENTAGDFFGVAKVVYNLEDVFVLIDEIRKTKINIPGFALPRESVNATLLTADGRLIYSAVGGFGNLVDASSFLTAAQSDSGVWQGEGREKLFSHYHSSGYNDFKGLGWVLIIEKDLNEVLAPLVTLVDWLFVSIVLALLLTFFTAILLSRLIGVPIKKLRADVRRVQAGDWQSPISVSGQDEVGELALAFGEMIDNVKQSRAEVDIRVKAQTDEIKQKAVALTEQQKAILNVLEDVETEKQNAARERDKINLILQSIGDGVFVINQNKKIIVFNSVAEKISGFSVEEAMGKSYDKVLRFLFEKDENVNDLFIREALRTGEVKQMGNHTVLVRKDGKRVPVADSAAPFKDKAGAVAGCVVVFRDVTQEREIDRMKSEFVSVASHQLRTPLTGIKWFTELLLKKNLDATAKDYLHEIAVSNERMVRLVDDLLNVSRIETGRKFDIVLKDVNLVEVVKSVIAEQLPSAAEKKIKLSCAVDAPPELILSVDELKMRQVFQNLVSNAIKYSKEKTEVLIGCRSEKEQHLFYVKDQGVGIPLKQQAQVFSKFFRAENVITMHTDGTGLGLYIVKAIVEAHGGRVWFESVENKGTTFYFTLPNKT